MDVVIGFAGVILGAILIYLFSIRLAKRQTVELAGNRLKSAFSNELAILNQPMMKDNSLDVVELLESAFDKHNKAVNDFMMVLNRKQIRSFENIWREYYGGQENKEHLLLTQYANHLAEHKGFKNGREYAIHNIKKILEYAEMTSIF